MSPLLDACEVSFAYPQDGRGLAPVSLQVEPGAAVLVGGPSGCGKSTLARCLAGLIPHLYRGAYGGQVCVNGQPAVDTPLWRLAEQVGMVFQNPAAQMLAPTVEDEILFGLENLGLPRAEVAERLEAALERFGLAAMRRRSPQTLSGGEQQKLALAAITARRPAALVLDEPLSMLDTTAAFEFVAHTRELAAAGAAVIYCEHRQEYVRGLPGLQTVALPGRQPSPGPAQSAPAWPLAACQPFTLQVNGLSVSRGGRQILRDLDLSLPAGQTIALVGRNGVGKTTLFRALVGLQKYSGSIQVHIGSKMEPPQLGIVFQNPDLQLFNASVESEILYRLEQPQMALFEWVMAALELERYANTPPLLLSEGEKRRVALATMLMRSPRHGLLLDEPALGQDAAHKAILLQLLAAYAAAGYLVVFSTHDIELAAHADYLVLLGSDGIAAQGRPAEVLALGDVWRRLGLTLPEWVEAPCSA